MNASRAAVLDPFDKLLERHLIAELPFFFALIKRNDAIPWIANESKFKVALKLFLPGIDPSLFRQRQIKHFHDAIFSTAHMCPIILHVILDLPETEMRFPRLSQNSANTGRASLGHLNKNAFVFVRD